MSRLLQIEKELQSFFFQIPVGVTPGLQLQAFLKGQKIVDTQFGQTYAYYDWASLTKPLMTALACAWAHDQNKINIESHLNQYIPDFNSDRITIRDLLCHQSHLPSYFPFYKEMNPEFYKENRDLIKNKILKMPLLESTKAVYSDLGYILLMDVLEKAFDRPFKDVINLVFSVFYPHVESLHYCYDNKPIYNKQYYAPTARCPWRDKLVQGEVHDEVAWLMGGEVSHAGLFGSINDLAWATLVLRAQMLGLGKKIIKQKTAQLFLERAMPHSQGDWTLGWMLPSLGESSAGQYFSDRSIGHLGFTGTSFWFDPDQDLIVALLSNRVFYGRDNKEFNFWRPRIHDKVVELINKY